MKLLPLVLPRLPLNPSVVSLGVLGLPMTMVGKQVTPPPLQLFVAPRTLTSATPFQWRTAHGLHALGYLRVPQKVVQV